MKSRWNTVESIKIKILIAFLDKLVFPYYVKVWKQFLSYNRNLLNFVKSLTNLTKRQML